MPTKKEIYEIEKENTGVIHLYAEGMFYRAYEMSAYLLCTLIHPFKVSGHFVKIVGDNLLSVGFPQSSLEKWSCGHPMKKNLVGVDILPNINELGNIGGFYLWKGDHLASSYLLISINPFAIQADKSIFAAKFFKLKIKIMKKEILDTKKAYKAPQAKVAEVKVQGMLCQSTFTLTDNQVEKGDDDVYGGPTGW